jgi:acyl carrier protein
LGATGTKLERKAAVEEQALATVRQLLHELGSARGLEDLAARRTAAHLERELGLGSLERVELMLRLSESCGERLPDRVVAEADTVQDLIDALLREDSIAQIHPPAPQAGRAAAISAAAVSSPRPRRASSSRRNAKRNPPSPRARRACPQTHLPLRRKRTIARNHFRRAV